jgi:hypothetical protein
VNVAADPRYLTDDGFGIVKLLLNVSKRSSDAASCAASTSRQ